MSNTYAYPEITPASVTARKFVERLAFLAGTVVTAIGLYSLSVPTLEHSTEVDQVLRLPTEDIPAGIDRTIGWYEETEEFGASLTAEGICIFACGSSMRSRRQFRREA